MIQILFYLLLNELENPAKEQNVVLLEPYRSYVTNGVTVIGWIEKY